MTTQENTSSITEYALAGLRTHERVAAWATVLFASIAGLFVLSAATGAGAGGGATPATATATGTSTASATATETVTYTPTPTPTATATSTSTPVPPTNTPVPPTATAQPALPPPPPPPTATPVPPPPPVASGGLSPAGMDGYSRALFDGTNARRASVGLPPLRENGYLNAIAQMRSREMAEYNYFAHTSPITGKNVFALMDDYGVPYGWAGENLAKNNYPDDQAASVAEQALWDSPSHHANIVNPNYTDAGIALAVDATGMKYFTILFTD
ncbi:MAG: hypothetical protein HY873_06160 [Chloroflexi bacterium]|nr:hypothetical protein [Chloroflexota bacterium]